MMQHYGGTLRFSLSNYIALYEFLSVPSRSTPSCCVYWRVCGLGISKREITEQHKCLYLCLSHIPCPLVHRRFCSQLNTCNRYPICGILDQSMIIDCLIDWRDETTKPVITQCSEINHWYTRFCWLYITSMSVSVCCLHGVYIESHHPFHYFGKPSFYH